jgi:hypothetical protein
MEIFTLNVGSWVRRLVTRGPLVRTSDRIEAAAVFLVLLVALLAVPVVGAVGTTRYDSRAHAYASQRLTSHEIDATTTQDSLPSTLPYQNTFLTQVQWQFAGRQHAGTIATPAEMKRGDHKRIWIDAEGNRIVAPPTDRDAAIDAVSVAGAAWLFIVSVGATGLMVLRHQLDQRRYAEWDRELADLGDNGRTNRSG